MSTLLVIDDEPNLLYSLEKALRSDTLEVITANTARQGIELVERRQPDVVILDVRLPDLSGLEAFDRMREVDARLPVIIITAFAAPETGIEAMKRGAFDYLLKPVDLHQLKDVVGKALELSRLRHAPVVFEASSLPECMSADRIVGRSPAMQEVYKAIGRVARQNVTVLITGESGTGKELVARAIYQHSDRDKAAFLALNCAAIPEALLESELFGHEKGAFTGADRQRIGKFEQCSGGTLFLDELGDMPLATQAKMLRLLQEQCFERIGGSETISADVRLIAATNRDLGEMVKTGRFRADLYYRLNVFTIHLPPLRDRRDDLPLLVEYLVKQSSRELNRNVQGVSPEALKMLDQYGWPGNIRELQSAIKYAVLHAGGQVVTPDCFPEGTRIGPVPPPAGSLDVIRMIQDFLRSGESEVYHKVCLAVDHAVLTEVLRHTSGNQGIASELLGISRTTLRSKLRALGLSVERRLESQPDRDE